MGDLTGTKACEGLPKQQGERTQTLCRVMGLAFGFCFCDGGC